MSGKLNDVRYNRIDDSYINVFVPSLAGLTFLVELDLSFNDIKCPGACIIASYIQNDKFIRRLSLKSNSIETVGGIALAKAIQLNETLHRFDISYNSVGERTGQQIACTLQINYSLTHLSIAGCSLGSSSIIALATALQNNDNIRYIDISNNKIHPSLESDVVMHISNMLRYNDGIMEFNLSKFGIGDWTMVNHLSGAIRWNRKISKLNLSCNRITKDGCVALAKSLIDTQRVLTILNLSCCAVQDEGAANIAAMLGRNSTLVKLYIDHNKITGRGLRNLSKALMLNRSIQYITLWGNLWDVPACDVVTKEKDVHELCKLELVKLDQEMMALKQELDVEKTKVLDLERQLNSRNLFIGKIESVAKTTADKLAANQKMLMSHVQESKNHQIECAALKAQLAQTIGFLPASMKKTVSDLLDESFLTPQLADQLEDLHITETIAKASI
ncbi:hypothetical protein HDU99_010974 [Rhizoclosmatium hyalinum]|nr:hypothetical protein HDU99_010974 [Rhizoclosmatium hyalinum]